MLLIYIKIPTSLLEDYSLDIMMCLVASNAYGKTVSLITILIQNSKTKQHHCLSSDNKTIRSAVVYATLSNENGSGEAVQKHYTSI